MTCGTRASGNSRYLAEGFRRGFCSRSRPFDSVSRDALRIASASSAIRSRSSGGSSTSACLPKLSTQRPISSVFDKAKAQYAIGDCYLYGAGVEEDDEKAEAWFRKAAEQGNAVGQCRLGNCYLSGIGVEEDAAQAVEWYRKAAVQGDDEPTRQGR